MCLEPLYEFDHGVVILNGLIRQVDGSTKIRRVDIKPRPTPCFEHGVKRCRVFRMIGLIVLSVDIGLELIYPQGGAVDVCIHETFVYIDGNLVNKKVLHIGGNAIQHRKQTLHIRGDIDKGSFEFLLLVLSHLFYHLDSRVQTSLFLYEVFAHTIDLYCIRVIRLFHVPIDADQGIHGLVQRLVGF